MAPIFNPEQHPVSQKWRQFWDWLRQTHSEETPQGVPAESSPSSPPEKHQQGPHCLASDLTPLPGDTYEWLHHTEEPYTLELIQNGQFIGQDLSLIPHPDGLRHATYQDRNLSCESILTLKNGYVIGHYGAILTSDWVILGDQNVDARGLSPFVLQTTQSIIARHQQEQIPIRTLPKRVLVLTHTWPDVYGHFLIECITKLSLLEICPQTFDAVILGNPLPSCAIEVLSQLGIRPDQIIQIKEHEIIQAESLIILSLTSFYPFYDYGTLNWVRQKFLPRPQGQGASGHRRVYWPRFDRRLKNEAQIMRVLQHWGVECIDHRGMSLKEQIEILMETSVFICFHGSGLTNLIFLPRQAAIIEIQQRQSDSSLFKVMAKTLQIRFIELKSEMVDDQALKKTPASHHMPSTMPPKRLETLLRQHSGLFPNMSSPETTVAVLRRLSHTENKPIPTVTMKSLFSHHHFGAFSPNQLIACEKGSTWPPVQQVACHRGLEKNLDSLDPLIQQGKPFQYLLTLKNGAILSNRGIVLTAEGQYIHDFPCPQHAGLNDWFDQSAKASLNKAFQDEAVRVHFISGRILCLTGLYSRGYWPFLTEYLPRILIAEKLSVAFDGIAISARARNNMENMLEGLGLSLSQVHFIEDDHLYFVDELLVPSITWANTLNNQEVFHWLRAHYQKNKKNALKPFRKIFWARAKNDPRRFSNVDEIIPWLLEKGFEIYEDVPRPVQEQARIFSEASIVIFPHGSGGTNLIFCQPKTQVIEIMNQMENPYTFNMYKNVCESCGLSYASVLTETTFQHFNSRYSKNDHARLHLADLIQKYEELNIH